MTERILKENLLIVKLTELRKDFQRAEEKYSKLKNEIEKYENALEVLNLLASNGSEDLSNFKNIEEERKFNLAIEALQAKNGEAVNYKEIHDYIVSKVPNYLVTPQSTYSFIKLKSKPNSPILFVGKGLFRLNPLASFLVSLDFWNIYD